VILIDSNLTPFWVEFLRSEGIDSVHWWTVGKGDAPDTDLMDWAGARNAIILTGDGDFSQLLALGKLSSPSLIFLRTSERNPEGPGLSVVEAHRRIVGRSEGGMIVMIDDRGIRMRALPILDNG
jgi:predicted nuclease of predicted toxin-antitoxin system